MAEQLSRLLSRLCPFRAVFIILINLPLSPMVSSPSPHPQKSPDLIRDDLDKPCESPFVSQ
jgi:hypothetical protein